MLAQSRSGKATGRAATGAPICITNMHTSTVNIYILVQYAYTICTHLQYINIGLFPKLSETS